MGGRSDGCQNIQPAIEVYSWEKMRWGEVLARDWSLRGSIGSKRV